MGKKKGEGHGRGDGVLPEAPDSPYRVPTTGGFELASAPTAAPAGAPEDRECVEQLREVVDRLDDLQRRLYAENRRALLCIFQATDAAGKDSTIRAVFSGINPAGFQVSSFKQPSEEELDHDFLWRSTLRLPERGRIGVFNRSYYEEVLVVRVHPEYLESQRLPGPLRRDALWQQRYESIRDHEKHLARNGTAILKFFLNVSREEQRRRFLSRIDDPDKNWKFSGGDVAERAHWDAYMKAYESALAETARPWAPWYAIPADRKPYMRLAVAEIVEAAMLGLDPRYPEAGAEHLRELGRYRAELESEEG